QIQITAKAAITAPLALDTTFGGGTSAGRTLFSTVGGQTRSITQTSDGKIVVVGNNSNSNAPSAIRVARMNANGTLDQGFSHSANGGTVRGAFDLDLTPFSDQAQAVAVQPDGKILIAGNVVGVTTASPYNAFLTRLNADGTTDTTFGTNGLVTLNI